jgi:hypothetical protein
LPLNQAGAYRTVSNISKGLKGVGYVGVIAGTFVGGLNMHKNGYSSESVVRFGMGLGITASAFVPVVGAPLSIILSTMEMEGGMDGIYNSSRNLW